MVDADGFNYRHSQWSCWLQVVSQNGATAPAGRDDQERGAESGTSTPTGGQNPVHRSRWRIPARQPSKERQVKSPTPMGTLEKVAFISAISCMQMLMQEHFVQRASHDGTALCTNVLALLFALPGIKVI